MSSVTLRILDELKRELEQVCREQNRPVSDAVRDAVRRYVAREQFHTLRRKTLPLAEAQGFLTDEDVFEATT